MSVYRWWIKWKLFTSFCSSISAFSNYALISFFRHKSLLRCFMPLLSLPLSLMYKIVSSKRQLQNNNNNNVHDYCYHFTFSYLLAKGHNLTDSMKNESQLLRLDNSVLLLICAHTFICSLIICNRNENCAYRDIYTPL